MSRGQAFDGSNRKAIPKSCLLASILLLALHVEMMQYAVKDRSQYEAGCDDKQKTREDRVGSCENLPGRGFQLAHWAHAGKNHRRIDVGIRKRHALEAGIAGHSDGQTDNGKDAPQPDGLEHATGKATARQKRLATRFQAGDSTRGHVGQSCIERCTSSSVTVVNRVAEPRNARGDPVSEQPLPSAPADPMGP